MQAESGNLLSSIIKRARMPISSSTSASHYLWKATSPKTGNEA